MSEEQQWSNNLKHGKKQMKLMKVWLTWLWNQNQPETRLVLSVGDMLDMLG